MFLSLSLYAILLNHLIWLKMSLGCEGVLVTGTPCPCTDFVAVVNSTKKSKKQRCGRCKHSQSKHSKSTKPLDSPPPLSTSPSTTISQILQKHTGTTTTQRPLTNLSDADARSEAVAGFRPPPRFQSYASASQHRRSSTLVVSLIY